MPKRLFSSTSGLLHSPWAPLVARLRPASDLAAAAKRGAKGHGLPAGEARLLTCLRTSLSLASNHFAMWQMNFPVELPSGKRNPVCSLGECGDPSCPTYRPKRPEVRRAVEQCILESLRL